MRQRNEVAIKLGMMSLSFFLSELFAFLPEGVVVGSEFLHRLLIHINIRIPIFYIIYILEGEEKAVDTSI